MNTSQFRYYLSTYRVVFVFLALCVLEIIALFRAPGWYSNTSILNTLAFIGVSYLTFSPLFGQAHSFLWAILWSVLVTGPLGWFFGISAVVLYWYLFSKKKKTGTGATSSSGGTASGTGATSSSRTCSRITWHILPKGASGEIARFTPLMTFFRIPKFWKKIVFVQDENNIDVIDETNILIYHKKSIHPLTQCCDPDYTSPGFWGTLCGVQVLSLRRHGKKTTKKKADDTPETPLFFGVRNSESAIVVSNIKKLIINTCDWQGVKRVGHA